MTTSIDVDLDAITAEITGHLDDGPLGRDNTVMASPSNPMAAARDIAAGFMQDGLPTVRRLHDQWYRWTGNRWAELSAADLQDRLYKATEHAVYVKRDKGGQPVIGDDDKPVHVGWTPTRKKIGDLTEALMSVVKAPDDTQAPSWLDGEPGLEPSQIIACRNGLLDMGTRDLAEHTPAFFNLVSVPFDYDPHAPAPTEFLRFLDSIWPDDPDSVALLQEWFGYVLSGRTDLQKILLFLGPPRSGKGTIARILTALIGKANVAAPNMSAFVSEFGLSNLVGRSLAVVGDARLPKLGAEIALERLLNISGEDTVDINRKYRAPWSGRLPARLMVMSNDIPGFADPSGALASRLLPIRTMRSFAGREDRGIEARALAELPGILLWALAGLDRLAANGGRFTEPESAREAMDLYRSQASPISQFLGDCCELTPDACTNKDVLYAAWRDWCAKEGRDHPGTLGKFGRDLFASGASIRDVQRRVGGQRVRMYEGVRLLDAHD